MVGTFSHACGDRLVLLDENDSSRDQSDCFHGGLPLPQRGVIVAFGFSLRQMSPRSEEPWLRKPP
jgi:hypothetical protein